MVGTRRGWPSEGGRCAGRQVRGRGERRGGRCSLYSDCNDVLRLSHEC